MMLEWMPLLIGLAVAVVVYGVGARWLRRAQSSRQGG